MASVNFSSLVAEVKGSVGNNTYSRNKYGSYVKNRVSPTNPDTPAQQTWRERLSTAVAAWQALPDPEKNAFNVLAQNYTVKDRLGRQIKINGYNLFIRQQLLASKVDEQGTITNPFPLMNQKYNLVSLDLSTTAFIVRIDRNNTLSSTYVTIKASAPQSPGRMSFNPSTVVIIVPGIQTASEIENVDITTAYEAIHGSIAAALNQRVVIGIQSFNYQSGERSADFFLQQLITE